jgi:probable HAF family extracellular repeat protein
MARQHTRLTAGVAVALVLLTGAPAAAASTAPGTLRKVALDSAGASTARVLYVNGRGDIVGYLPAPAAGGGSRPVLWRRYDTLIDLGRPGDLPYALNNRGDVLGDTWIWSNGRVVPLAHPSRPVSAADLNDRRQVVGTLEGSSPPSTRAFRWQNGQFTDLGAPGEERWTRGTAVNNEGTVMGWVYQTLGVPAGGFVWRDGVMTVFGTDLAYISPLEINDRGQVLSNGQVTEEGSNHPFLWHRGRMVDLMAGRPDAFGIGQDINGAGDVVGSMDSRPVLWRDGRAIHLLPEGWRGTAVSVNERGDVAGVVGSGTGEDPDGRVFLWRNGRVLLSEPETGVFANPYVAGLDDRGRVAGGLGDSTGATGESRAYVWIP